jgi:two-component system, OmpR family, copper resistance phosphate regulon response regulator CusR
MKDKILLIEDEIKTAQSLKKGLEEYHYEVDLAYDGDEGLKLVMVKSYHLIISDIIMPNLTGVEFCIKLREKGNSVPLLLLTALGTINDKVIGFEAGADDYLVKPFEFKELLVRVRALVKRSTIIRDEKNRLHFSDLELDLESRSVYRGDETIELTAREFALMEYLIRNPERIISKKEIAEKVWDITFDTGTNVIEVYVNYLRNKIDKNFSNKLIHTAHGMGYILKEK